MMLKEVTWWLVIIGALNWGFTAFGFNLVNVLLGSIPMLEMIVYVLVGLSGVYALLNKFEIL